MAPIIVILKASFWRVTANVVPLAVEKKIEDHFVVTKEKSDTVVTVESDVHAVAIGNDAYGDSTARIFPYASVSFFAISLIFA